MAPLERNILIDTSVGPEWKTNDVPFEAQYDIAASEGFIGFTFGALAQKVEITSVQVLNFEHRITLEKLPLARFTYQGRKANVAWRNEALKRIGEVRHRYLTTKSSGCKS